MQEILETKVSRDALRQMMVGDTLTFDQQNRAGLESGRSLVYQAANVLGAKFTIKQDYAVNTITVTRIK